MNFKSVIVAAAVAAIFQVASTATYAAAVLTGNLTADNQFAVYISSSDATLGTPIGEGDNWQSTYSLAPTDLTAGTYYLHIVGYNFGGPSTGFAGGNPDALIGQFTLSGNYVFANGSTTLLTDTTNWRATDAAYNLAQPPSWIAPAGTPIDYGANASSNIWFNASGSARPGIASNAEWIWSLPDQTGEAFFSTTISSAVPEPSTWALMLVGFLSLGLINRRRMLAMAGRVV